MLGRGEWRYRGTGSGLTGMRFPSEKQTHEARVGINDEKRSAFILGEFSGRAQRPINILHQIPALIKTRVSIRNILATSYRQANREDPRPIDRREGSSRENTNLRRRPAICNNTLRHSWDGRVLINKRLSEPTMIPASSYFPPAPSLFTYS